jgi:hypothetical protein
MLLGISTVVPIVLGRGLSRYVVVETDDAKAWTKGSAWLFCGPSLVRVFIVIPVLKNHLKNFYPDAVKIPETILNRCGRSVTAGYAFVAVPGSLTDVTNKEIGQGIQNVLRPQGNCSTGNQ